MPNTDTSILVVDDTKFSSAMVNRVIARAGYLNVRHANSAATALKLLEERPAHILIADWLMPEMDGLEATRTIRNLDREDCKKIQIYAMSANAFDEDVKRSLASGMNGHLSKPVNLQVLEKTLQKVLG